MKLRPCIISGELTANKFKGKFVSYRMITKANKLRKKISKETGKTVSLAQALDCILNARKQIESRDD